LSRGNEYGPCYGDGCDSSAACSESYGYQGLLHEGISNCDCPFWLGAEYLGWFIKGNQVPPLVTTSPNGVLREEAGVLGQNTDVLFGGGIDDDHRPGIRVQGGFWLDPCRSHGLELGYLTLFDQSDDYVAATASAFGGGAGLPILARPFFNVEAGEEAAELVSFPDIVDGAVGVHTSSQLDSAEALYRRNYYRGCRGGLDVLAGYRYFRFDENLAIGEDLVVTETGGLIANGTRIQLVDQFSADNSFHGGQLGMSAQFSRDYVSVELLAKVALGGITRKTRIRGGTRVRVPGGGTSESSGGLLALPTNIGTYKESSFAALPEFGANLRLRLTECTHLTAGYTLLLLNDVARTGAAIDRAVNPGFIPGGILVDPTRRPAFLGNSNDFWVQGFSLGLLITM
jgi:hypothetical protein